jgi:predicted RNase H-like HicB family nuclease
MASRRFALTAVYETVEQGWVQARVHELPGVITAAPTRTEAEELLLDAIHEYLVAMRSDSNDIDPEHDAQQAGVEVTLAL